MRKGSILCLTLLLMSAVSIENKAEVNTMNYEEIVRINTVNQKTHQLDSVLKELKTANEKFK